MECLVVSSPTIAEFLRGSRHAGDGPEYIAMLWAYLDDSSDDKRERFCAAGGFFTIDSRWRKLETDWRRVTVGLKEPFRSTDCECGHGQFAEWPKPARDSLMAELCEIVRHHDLGAFGACVSVSDYREVFPDADQHDPYLLCLGLCFANIAEITELSNRVVAASTSMPLPVLDVHFWVEENRDTAARATQVYHDLKSIASWTPSRRMASISHLGKGIVGLQAADLIAREVYKHYDNRGIRPVRKPVITLSNNVTFLGLTLQNLRDIQAMGVKSSYAEAIIAVARKVTRTAAIPITPPLDFV